MDIIDKLKSDELYDGFLEMMIDMLMGHEESTRCFFFKKIMVE